MTGQAHPWRHLQGDFRLEGDHFAGDALLPLFEGFAHAEDDGQPGIKGGADRFCTVTSVSPK